MKTLERERAKAKVKLVRELIDGLREPEWRAIKHFVDCRYRDEIIKIRLDSQSLNSITVDSLENDLYQFDFSYVCMNDG